MQIDRRDLLTGLAVTAAAPCLPVFVKASAGGPRFDAPAVLPEVAGVEAEQQIAAGSRAIAAYRAAVRARDHRRRASRSLLPPPA